MKIIVSGGAGYIGSSICSYLLDNGHTPVILDSLITGKKEFVNNRIFYKGDIADESLIRDITEDHPDIYAAVHCAALIVVPESVEKPYDYYQENVCKSLKFFNLLEKNGISRIVFSSSASLYDKVPGFMVTEDSPLKPSSPYARTKYMMEMILQDICRAGKLKGISLRYFNPIGSDPEMRTGMHIEFPSHVLGKLVDTAVGKQDFFEITGTEWPTRDGSGIRDYIHIWDLASAHLAAIEEFDNILQGDKNYTTINLGSGNGVTVKELVTAFENVWGKEIDKKEAPPRPGDAAGAYANADLAYKLLGWKTRYTIEDGIKHALEWEERRKKILGYH